MSKHVKNGHPDEVTVPDLMSRLSKTKLCWWTGKAKNECGCDGICPNCGRVGHDPTVEKCYLC